MQTIQLAHRTSFKYRDGWDNLDEWVQLYTLRLTPARLTSYSDSYDEGGTWVQHARIPAGADWRAVARAVQDTMGGTSCRHEHDCCGCAIRHVSARLVAPRRLMVVTRVSYNY